MEPLPVADVDKSDRPQVGSQRPHLVDDRLKPLAGHVLIQDQD
jgi:hypothetical protein